MPPENAPHMNEVHMPPKKNPMGPLIGIVIIIFVLFIGAFYIWGAQLNRQDQNTIPYIPGDATTTDSSNQ